MIDLIGMASFGDDQVTPTQIRSARDKARWANLSCDMKKARVARIVEARERKMKAALSKRSNILIFYLSRYFIYSLVKSPYYLLYLPY